MKKTRKRKGGLDSILSYAHKMKNKEPIDATIFKACLDKTLNPLKILLTLDNKQYTINEWALICEVDSSIYDVFCNYEYDLSRRIEYPFHLLYNMKYKNSLLEAYLLKSNHLNSISTMIKQIQSSSMDIINNNMYYHWYSESVVPTIIKCMFDMISISKSNIHIALSTPILAFYTDINMLNRLTDNKNPQTMIKLFYYAITSNSVGLLQLISTQLTPTLILEYVLNSEIVEALLIQDNQDLYMNVIMLLNGADANVIGAFICKILGKDCTNDNVVKILDLCSTSSHKQFFEVIGYYAIDKLMIPDIQKNPHIIVICHGTSTGHEEYKYNFKMRQLCYYADKGCVLIDNNPYSKPIEQLICSGYYDATLKCKPANDGTITTENILFSFNPNDYVQDVNNYLGYYICNHGQVTKINTKIDRSATYDINYIMELSAQIADLLLGNAAEVDLMIYSCIGYYGTTNSTMTIPKYNI